MLMVLLSCPLVVVVIKLCSVMLSVDRAAPLNDAEPFSIMNVELRLVKGTTTDFGHLGSWISLRVTVKLVPAVKVPALPVIVTFVPDIVHVGVVITEDRQFTIPEGRPKSDVKSRVSLYPALYFD